MQRRTGFALVLVAVLVASGGCLDLVTGGTATFASSPVAVDDATLESTGYDLASNETRSLNRTFSAAGQERTIEVTNHVAEYERSVDLGQVGSEDLARFVAMSTPAVEVAGRTFNPVGEWSQRRIVTELASQYEGVSDVSYVDNRTVRSLGGQRTVSAFSATATLAGGQEVDVTFHVTTFRHGGDFVVAVGVHPEQLPDERSKVDAMIRGLTH